jgi:hypothetical protein
MADDSKRPEDRLKELSEEVKSISEAASLLFNQQRLKLAPSITIYFETLIRSCSTLAVYGNLVATNASSKHGAVLMCLEEGNYLEALASKLKEIFASYVNEHVRSFADDMNAIAKRIAEIMDLIKPMISEKNDEA